MKTQRWMAGAATAVVLALAGVLPAQAQVPAPSKDSLTISRIEMGRTQTPTYNSRSQLRVKEELKDWFRIEITYDTEPKWTDEVTFTYYVLLKNEANAKPGDPRSAFRVLKGQTTDINVPEGRNHYNVIFIHPRTIERYGAIERVAVVATAGGVTVAMASQPESRTRWWEELAPMEGLLLNRMETPFGLIAHDRYEANKSGVPAGR